MANYVYYEFDLKGEFYDNIDFLCFLNDLRNSYYSKVNKYLYYDEVIIDQKYGKFEDPIFKLEVSFRWTEPDDFEDLLDKYCIENDRKIEAMYFSECESYEKTIRKFPSSLSLPDKCKKSEVNHEKH